MNVKLSIVHAWDKSCFLSTNSTRNRFFSLTMAPFVELFNTVFSHPTCTNCLGSYLLPFLELALTAVCYLYTLTI